MRRADDTAVGLCEQGEAGFGRCAASAREGEGGFADLAARPKPQVLVIHSRGLSWRNLDLGAPDIAVARDRIGSISVSTAATSG